LDGNSLDTGRGSVSYFLPQNVLVKMAGIVW